MPHITITLTQLEAQHLVQLIEEMFDYTTPEDDGVLTHVILMRTPARASLLSIRLQINGKL